MPEIAILIHDSRILDTEPRIRSLDGDLPERSRGNLFPDVINNGDIPSGNRFAQSSALYLKVFKSGITGKDYTGFGCTVHAADGHSEFIHEEILTGRVEWFSGIREFLYVVSVSVYQPGLNEHPVHRGSRRKIGDFKLFQRLQDLLTIKLPGIMTGRDAQRPRRDRSVPHSVAPGG